MDTPTLKRKNVILIIGLLIAALYFPVVGHLLFAGRGRSLLTMYLSRLFIWSGVLLLYFYAHKVEKNDLLLWKEKKQVFLFYVASIIIMYVIIFICGRLSIIPYYFGWREKSTVMYKMLHLLRQNMPLLVFSAITAGITEELICRGYLMPRIELLVKNRYLPVIISALIFSANHFAYFSLYELIFTFLFGIVFALHYQKFRNLKVLMISHGLTDLIGFLSFRDHPAKGH